MFVYVLEAVDPNPTFVKPIRYEPHIYKVIYIQLRHDYSSTYLKIEDEHKRDFCTVPSCMLISCGTFQDILVAIIPFNYLYDIHMYTQHYHCYWSFLCLHQTADLALSVSHILLTFASG